MPKAVQFDSYGGVDVLEVRDVPRPVPGAGEVLVEVRADWRPAVSEETLRDVLGGAGWDITSLDPATQHGELDDAPVEMAFWYLRAQRR
jgi:hypothetical protein